ncbi:hypothetical protein O181_132182 [Austropuccinia psidii MF-1]|uniref:Uncharacterized protein n=1 Tax=Austropuccinia psidii MF-1 TaxID=1389203 RepID=A0A9Q3L4H9_9BASI|nr:hypothetical protein [Austropuccinia psidii MF-1]
MKAPECFDGTKPFIFSSFIQSGQLIFHNNPANLSQDREKVLYATSFPISSAEKWIEPYISNPTNQDPNYLLNKWSLFESQLFTLFGDPNEVRKSEEELDSLRMKGRDCHPGIWINWPPILQELVYFTLELDTRYHGRQKDQCHHQEKKPQASKSNSSHPQTFSSSSKKKKKNRQKRDKPHSSLLNKDFKLMNSKKEGKSRRVYVPIVVGIIVFSPVSKGLRTGFPNPQAIFPAREMPE